MKKHLYILLSIVVLGSCTSLLTDEINESNRLINEAIKDNADRIERLEKLCQEINTNITSINVILQALQKNDYISSVTPINENGKIVGYTISFIKSGDVTIYQGKDGLDAPQISVRKDSDGLYYWAINGAWLLNTDGNKIRVEAIDGITPQLRIRDEKWEVSYDAGKNWTVLGAAVGEDGKTLFSSVRLTDTAFDMVLGDGTEISIPIYKKVEISFEIPDGDVGIAAGKRVMVDYKLSGNTENAHVTASSDGNYMVRIENKTSNSGCLVITCPGIYADGYINVQVNDIYGYSSVKVIRFYEGKMLFDKGLEYSVPSDGGRVEVPFKVNIDYRIEIPHDAQSWLTLLPGTKAGLRDELICFSASINKSFSSRQARIPLYDKNNAREPFTEIIINQASAYFNIDKSNHAVGAEGGELISNITSTMGLQVRIPANVSWLRYETENKEDKLYSVKFIVDANAGASERNCAVFLYSGDGSSYMGSLSIIQLCQEPEDPNDMI